MNGHEMSQFFVLGRARFLIQFENERKVKIEMSEKFYDRASSCENLSIGFFPFRSAQLLLLVALKMVSKGRKYFQNLPSSSPTRFEGKFGLQLLTQSGFNNWAVEISTRKYFMNSQC